MSSAKSVYSIGCTEMFFFFVILHIMVSWQKMYVIVKQIFGISFISKYEILSVLHILEK